MRKYLLLFVLAMLAKGQAGTGFPGPIQVQPGSGAAEALELLAANGNYSIGFVSPNTIPSMVINTATAANPMVLTLLGNTPTTITAGSTIVVTGAAGTGCSGMNATQTVTATTSTTITISFNGTGCTYTTQTASFPVSLRFEVPSVDSSSGYCWGWSSAYKIGWVTCGGSSGANIQLSNLGTTAINANLLPGADDTIKIGDAYRFYQVSANRFEGSCSLCSATNNYLSTRKLNLFDQGGTSDVNWDLMTTYSGVNNWTEFRDNAGTSTLRLQRASFTGDPNVAIFDLNLLRGSTGRNLGSATVPWISTYTQNLRVTSLGTTGTRCVQTDTNGDLSQAAAACGSGGTAPFIDTTAILYSAATPANTLTESLAGLTAARTWTLPDFDMVPAATNHTQTFSADQTLSADLLASANTKKLGNGTPFYQVQANRFEGSCSLCSATDNFVNTRKLNIYDQTGISDAGWDIMTYVTGVGGTSYISFRDNVGVEALRLSTWETVNINQAKFALNVVPNGSFTVGVAGNPWPYGYFTDLRAAALAGAGTRLACVDPDGDFTVTSCTGMTNPLTTTGDIIYSSSGTTAARLGIGSSNQLLTVSGGLPAWVTPSFANTTLSNLGTTAVNANINPGADNTIDFADATTRYSDAYFGGIVRVSTASAGTRFCQMSGGSFTCSNGGVTMFSATSLGALESYGLSGSGGTRCVQVDNGGVFAVAAAGCGIGTVTSVGQSFTGGLISVSGSPVTTSGTLALTVAGTSGGVPYFSSASTWASSAALTANLPVIGGGAGGAPSVGTRSGNTTAFVTTTGTQTNGNCVSIDANGNHVANGAACATAGANTTLSNLGTTAINADLLPSGTRNLGSSGNPWAAVFSNQHACPSSSFLSQCFTTGTTGAVGTPMGIYGDGNIYAGLITPGTGNTHDLGTSTYTWRTLYLATGLAGTFNLSGNETVTGNWYARTFSGANASCGPVADGWLGIRTDIGGASGKPEIQVCIGGAMKYSALN